MVARDGSTQQLTTLHVRATEYTVGPSGPNAMPAGLPPQTAYTYAVDFSVDEAIAAGAIQVRFTSPVISYVENFLGFPVGTVVPGGAYDAERGEWEAVANGRVVQVLSVAGGVATLDVSGDGQPATPAQLAELGIAEAELVELARLYAEGQRLWRNPLNHLTPLDYNFPAQPPPDAEPPKEEPERRDKREDDECEQGGSIIGCNSRVLGERVPIAGTPFSLAFSSDRTRAWKPAFTIDVPITGDEVPASLKRVGLEVLVGGRIFESSFSPAAGQVSSFSWDGLDAYGRPWQGTAPVRVRVRYWYDGVYQAAPDLQPAFGVASGSSLGVPSRTEVALGEEWRLSLGAWDSSGVGLAGWVPSAHHAYDPNTGVLYLGSGRRRAADALEFGVLGRYAMRPNYGIGNNVTAAADGTLYVGSTDRVDRIDPRAGTATRVAGSGSRGFSGDGGPATAAQLSNVRGVALARDGSLLLLDADNYRVRKVDRDGVIATVAGGGTIYPPADGDPATSLNLSGNNLRGVAVGADGTVYFSVESRPGNTSVGKSIVFAVRGNGGIYRVAGEYGWVQSTGDGGPARLARLHSPGDLAIGPEGELLIAERSASADWARVRRIALDGTISTIAGTGQWGHTGDGGSALDARIAPDGLAVGRDGRIYIAERSYGIREVGSDGIIRTVAGGGPCLTVASPDQPATKCSFDPKDVSVGPEGYLYLAPVPYVVKPALPRLAEGTRLVPDEDGQAVFVFDVAGRHLSTVDRLTGATVYAFEYDPSGRLVAIRDGYGRATTIERDPAGSPTAIVSPYGHRTTLAVDPQGLLGSITDPMGFRTSFGYGGGGLLQSVQAPLLGTRSFEYDGDGLLTVDRGAGGSFQAFSSSQSGATKTVTRETAQGAHVTYGRAALATGGRTREVEFPAGLRTSATRLPSGASSVTTTRGNVITGETSGDPVFGSQVPIRSSTKLTTPGGLESTTLRSRSVQLADSDDPLSLLSVTDTTQTNGATWTTVFDRASATSVHRSPLGRETTVVFGPAGEVRRTTSGGFAPVDLEYDTYGRLVRTQQGGRTFTQERDTLGEVATATDPLGRTLTFGRDPLGRILRQWLPNGVVLLLSYDEAGRITSIQPPGRLPHAFEYDVDGRITRYVAPDLGDGLNATSWHYGLDGQLVSVDWPQGTSVTLQRDAAARVTGIVSPEGTRTITYSPTINAVERVTMPSGDTVDFEQDGGLTTGIVWAGTVAGGVHEVLDADFRPIRQRVDGGSDVLFAYDLDGLCIGAGDMSFTRDAASGLIVESALGTIVESFAYDAFGALVRQEAIAGGSTLYSVEITRDDLGRVAEQTEAILGEAPRTTAYVYDLAGRLAEVWRDSSLAVRYEYDDNGNRTLRETSGGTVRARHDQQDRLLEWGSKTYSYRASGELVGRSDSATTADDAFDYDSFGNLLAVTRDGSSLVEYVVDGQNHRVAREVAGAVTHGFLYDPRGRLVAELDEAGLVRTQLVHLPTAITPSYMLRGGRRYRILSDRRGSPRLVVDADSGVVAQRIDYDELGRTTRDTSPGFQPYGFAGGLYDSDTLLVRFGARDYEPEAGRFTAKDPIGLTLGATNLYEYAAGDPVNLRDTGGAKVSFETPAAEEAWEAAKAADPVVKYELSRLENDPTVDYYVRTNPQGKDRDRVRRKSGGALTRTGALQCNPDQGPVGGITDIEPELAAQTEESLGLDPSLAAIVAHEAGHFISHYYYGPLNPRDSEGMAQDLENRVREGQAEEEQSSPSDYHSQKEECECR